ncbi:MAG: CPBP family glutamic-type intramembrane protease [Algisphaera sp.]
MTQPTEPSTPPAVPPATPPPSRGVDKLDTFMADNPWNPRMVPFFAYIVLLTVLTFLPAAFDSLKPLIYVAQCCVVVALLWRYRKSTPELTASFHWMAIPTGVGLLVVWVVLGYAMGGELGWRWNQLTSEGGDWLNAFGPYPYDALDQQPNRFGPTLNAENQTEPHELQTLIQDHPLMGYLGLVLRLLGMSLVVPFFEELFIRSGMLRGLQHPKATFRGLAQFATDLPVIGEALERSVWGKKLASAPPALTTQLRDTPVGKITLFAVVASTLVFMLSHGLRDWPGCIACGVVWCGLVWWTNRPRAKHNETWASITETSKGQGRYGLGPVIWSHGITNALLWGYTVAFNDWRFL